MTVRSFERTFIEGDDGVRRHGNRIFCDCGTEERVSNSGQALGLEHLAKKFATKGWDVGKSPQHDKCPACVKRKATTRRLESATVIPINRSPPPCRRPPCSKSSPLSK